MPILDEFEKPARRVLNVFYVLDTSGSMGGAPITQLNCAMRETVEALRKQAKSNADAEVKVAVMEFNSNARWIQPNGPEAMEDFEWEDLEAGGLTAMGAALKELDSKLSRKAFLNSMTGAYLPVIIFMTDGYATDDYKKQLDVIRQNKWYTRATKIGFGLGDDPDLKMLSEVVGNCEAVIKTADLDLFAKLIQFASVTASMMASTSRTSSQALGGSDVVTGALAAAGVDPEDVTVSAQDVGTYSAEPVQPAGVAADDDDDEWD